MTTSAPKPGPHLHPSTFNPEAGDRSRPYFRELAKRHAADASEYLVLACDEAPLSSTRDELLALADVADQVSLACSAVAPVVPLRSIHDKAAGK